MAAITTTVVGSYPQPAWLVDRERFKGNVVPRVPLPGVWRVPAPLLDEAQDDAVRVAVGEMERAGIDVLSDGEQRRESYFNRFANALGGIDPDRPGLRDLTVHVRLRFGRVPRHGPIDQLLRVLGKVRERILDLHSGFARNVPVA